MGLQDRGCGGGSREGLHAEYRVISWRWRCAGGQVGRVHIGLAVRAGAKVPVKTSVVSPRQAELPAWGMTVERDVGCGALGDHAEPVQLIKVAQGALAPGME